MERTLDEIRSEVVWENPEGFPIPEGIELPDRKTLEEVRNTAYVSGDHDDRDRYPRNTNGILAVLSALGIDLRLNTRTGSIESRERYVGAEWFILSDRDIHYWRSLFTGRILFQGKNPIGKDSVFDLLEAVHAEIEKRGEGIDQLLDWVETNEWDGKKRIDNCIEKCFTINDKDNMEFVRAASRHMWIELASRLLEPGSKCDEMVVLIGPQGCGKSTWCGEILPDDLRKDMLCETVDLSDSHQRIAESIRGRAVVEVAELSGVTRAHLERMKQLITARTDVVRIPYAKHPSTISRTQVWVGTCNDDGAGVLPQDHSGNRRFLPVNLLHGTPDNVIEYMGNNRGQLWAEAVAMVRGGEKARFPDVMKEAHMEATELTQERDSDVEDAFELANLPISMEKTTDEIRQNGMLLSRIIEIICNDNSRVNRLRGLDKRIPRLLKKHGWSKRRLYIGNNKYSWRWYPPMEKMFDKFE